MRRHLRGKLPSGRKIIKDDASIRAEEVRIELIHIAGGSSDVHNSNDNPSRE